MPFVSEVLMVAHERPNASENSYGIRTSSERTRSVRYRPPERPLASRCHLVEGLGAERRDVLLITPAVVEGESTRTLQLRRRLWCGEHLGLVRRFFLAGGGRRVVSTLLMGALSENGTTRSTRSLHD